MIIHKNKIKGTLITSILVIGLTLIMNATAQAQTLSLKQCIDTALIYNRNIKLAQQDVNISTEKNKEIRGNLLPKLNGIADYRYYTDLPYQIMPAEAFGGPEGTYKEVQFGVPQSLNANLQLAVPIFNSTALNAIKSTRIAIELVGNSKDKNG